MRGAALSPRSQANIWPKFGCSEAEFVSATGLLKHGQRKDNHMDNEVVLVTGAAASGIGFEIARQFI
jgi:hypothetical protein